jgi:hypothetical protein
MSLIQNIYDEVHAALWAILVAFVLWFSVFVVPMLPAVRARTEMLRNHEISIEQDGYCGKLGMGPKTTMYRQCISVLEQYRTKIRQDIADETELFF